MTGMLDRPITCPNTRMIGHVPRHPIRPLRADDVDRVRRFYRGLSAESVYNRFFTGGQPGDAELRRLFDADPDARDVLVALSGHDVIGLVEGATPRNLPGAVEIGLVVADAWQGRGVGWQLIRAVVSQAAARGASIIQAHTLAENRRMARLMRRLCPDARPQLDDSIYTWLVPIGPALRALTLAT
jgi:RimJ/RimL family protein N-acetyltransferase